MYEVFFVIKSKKSYCELKKVAFSKLPVYASETLINSSTDVSILVLGLLKGLLSWKPLPNSLF